MSVVKNTTATAGRAGAPATGQQAAGTAPKSAVKIDGEGSLRHLNEKMGPGQQTPAPPKNNGQPPPPQDRHKIPSGPKDNGDNGLHLGHRNKQSQTTTPPTGNTPPIIDIEHPVGKGQTQTPTTNTPPIIANEHPILTGKPHTPPVKGQPPPTENTPPIIEYPETNNPSPRKNFPPGQTRDWKPQVLIFTTRTNDSSVPNGVLRNAVVEVLRQNDIYISRSVVNSLIGNQNSHGNQSLLNIPNSHGNQNLPTIPTEVRNLVLTVANQIASTVSSTNPPNNQHIRQLASVVSQNMQPQLSSVREVLVFTTQPEAKHFSTLNIQERVLLAVDLMSNHLPSNTNLSQLSNREIYNGFMLAHGLVTSDQNAAQVRNLVSFRVESLPMNYSIAGLRDLGQLVKTLITDAAGAKTTANLDLAVQKFVRILVSNNELGVLLAATALAKQAEIGGISMNRTLALVQVYQLISRLIQAGETAMKESAVKNGLTVKDAPGIELSKSIKPEEKNALLRDLQTSNLHSNLKNFLEFNPAFVAERSVSSFINSDDAQQAQQHFSAHHTDEIDQWLSSGNHRFVKEIDLEKPIGIVVERGAEDFFSASKARIVLVRDSSPQGWHFLKSFLVK